ncbi:MAG TPA: hypothetical protein VMB03_15495 [Bryobacteraceae bacterium]|nr:hypothetical protein [Bryobacteraceae bacterium]
MAVENAYLTPAEIIEHRILLIRSQKALHDSALAELYRLRTKVLIKP